MGFVLFICSIFCIVYWAVIFFYMGVQTTFTICLLGIGIIFGCLAFWYIREKKRDFPRFPLWIRVSCTTTFLTGLIVFFLLQLFILNGCFQTPQKNLDYIIVLGAEVKDGKPSPMLKERLNKAISYLRENENTKVIVSGGKIGEEERAQAETMALYLEEHGIATMRIIKERNSKNTAENITFSARLMEDNVTVGIVTSDFHIFRGVEIAKKTFSGHVSGISASSNWVLRFSNMMRESFAIIKDRFMGNL